MVGPAHCAHRCGNYRVIMKTGKLSNAYKGWFVGDFDNALLRCKDAELAVKHMKAGEVVPMHTHRVITEVTAVISGKFRINDRVYEADDLIVVSPGEAAEYACVEDGIMVVFKTPSMRDDKINVAAETA